MSAREAPAPVSSRREEAAWQRELGEWVTRVLRRHYAESREPEQGEERKAG